MIKAENIIKKYGDRTVLNIEKLKIEKGGRVALTGANGSGKSTFLKIVAGITGSEGDLSLSGDVLYMPQKTLCFDMSVLKNVTYSLKGSKSEKEDKAMAALKKVGIDNLYKANALSLSGGEAARLSLARILVRDCDLLLLDEPTGAVDVEGTQILEGAVNDYMNEKERTLIIATHSPLQAKRMCSRLIMLEKGVPVEDMPPEEFILSPKTQFGKKFADMWRY